MVSIALILLLFHTDNSFYMPMILYIADSTQVDDVTRRVTRGFEKYRFPDQRLHVLRFWFSQKNKLCLYLFTLIQSTDNQGLYTKL